MPPFKTVRIHKRAGFYNPHRFNSKLEVTAHVGKGKNKNVDLVLSDGLQAALKQPTALALFWAEGYEHEIVIIEPAHGDTDDYRIDKLHPNLSVNFLREDVIDGATYQVHLEDGQFFVDLRKPNR